jgi:hypothetical protein
MSFLVFNKTENPHFFLRDLPQLTKEHLITLQNLGYEQRKHSSSPLGVAATGKLTEPYKSK